MKKENIIKTFKYLNPFSKMEKLLIIAKEDNEKVDRLVFYTSKLFGKRIKKPERINRNKLKEETKFLNEKENEEIKKYLDIDLDNKEIKKISL